MNYKPPTYTAPKMEMVKQCSNCGKAVSDNATAGQSCPHCGVFWGEDRTTGKTAEAPMSTGGIIGAIVAVLIGIVTAIVKATSGR